MHAMTPLHRVARHRLRAAVCTVLALLASGCQLPPPQPPLTQLQLRQLQSRSYENRDLRTAMRAVINALLDEGKNQKEAMGAVGVTIKDLMVTQVFFSKTEGRFNANAVGGYSNFHSDSTGEAAK